MRILADENIAKVLVGALRARGHEVLSVGEEYSSTEDTDLLSIAVEQGRVLLTQDTDFGELVFRAPRQPCCGVILLRLRSVPVMVAADSIATLLTERDNWGDHFSVVEEHKVRQTPLPQ